MHGNGGAESGIGAVGASCAHPAARMSTALKVQALEARCCKHLSGGVLLLRFRYQLLSALEGIEAALLLRFLFG
jgi:hypothetical protein